MERQKHGFIFEEEMINKYNLAKLNNYTSQWDAEKEGKKYSIKVEKKVVILNLVTSLEMLLLIMTFT